MPKSTPPRKRAIQRLTARLLRRGSPRLQMMIFLTATGLTGFLASKLFHAVGLHTMAIRYPLAVGMAYLVFLFLLSMFVSYHRARRRSCPAGSSGDYDPDVDFFDGGCGPPYPPATTGVSRATSGKGSKGGDWGLDSLDGLDGEGAVVVAVVVLICIAIGSAIFASFWVLLEAPALLAEVLVDGALLVGLARRIKAGTGPHWASGAIRRTVWPLLVVAVCFAAVGYALEYLVPGATTMGDALRMAGHR